MNQRTDNERLLADVLTPEAGSGFSADVLAGTLHGVRRRRRVRQVRRLAAMIVLLTGVAFAFNHLFQRETKPELTRSAPTSYQLVVSRALAPGQIVGTRALAPDQWVTSTVVAQRVQTTSGGFGEIGDDELMALAAPQVVALVRRGPHEAELVFVPARAENSDSHQN